MATHFDTLDYLCNGNVRQQRAYTILKQHRLFETLRDFEPFLAGTIPIGIDIDGSDLDILCYWKNRNDFVDVVNSVFQAMEGFSLRSLVLHGHETVIVNFYLDGLPIEIFGTDIPVKEQMACRHLMIEHRLLEERGVEFRDAIIRLKESGMKTEPAFAKLLGLEGDPYLALLKC